MYCLASISILVHFTIFTTLPQLPPLSRFSCVRLCVTPETAAHRLPRPWDSPGKNTGVGCHCLLQCVKVKLLSRVRLLVTPWTVAYQASPSMGFSRQEHWSGLPLPSLFTTFLMCKLIFVFIALFMSEFSHVCLFPSDLGPLGYFHTVRFLA